MTQRATLRALDADILSAFEAAGMADTGDFVSPDGEVTEDITYYFDDVQFADVGEAGTRAMIRERQIGLMLGEVTPVENGRVIGDDGRTWRLVAPTSESDDSMSWWFVAPMRSDGA